MLRKRHIPRHRIPTKDHETRVPPVVAGGRSSVNQTHFGACSKQCVYNVSTCHVLLFLLPACSNYQFGHTQAMSVAVDLLAAVHMPHFPC